jgi:hypothetical protein
MKNLLQNEIGQVVGGCWICDNPNCYRGEILFTPKWLLAECVIGLFIGEVKFREMLKSSPEFMVKGLMNISREIGLHAAVYADPSVDFPLIG